MMRACLILLLAALAPAFAADAPAPGDGPGPSDAPEGYALISVADVVKITELLRQMTEALREQDTEIRRLRRLAERGGCT